MFFSLEYGAFLHQGSFPRDPRWACVIGTEVLKAEDIKTKTMWSFFVLYA